MAATVALVVSDLMFQPRIADAVRASGGEPLVADAAGALKQALALPPDGAVVDVHERLVDPIEAIRGFALAGVRVLAFGRHTEPQRLREARVAGASKVVARSDLVERLGELIEELLLQRTKPSV